MGGLLLSTLLTLVLVPASFSLADSFEKWLTPKFRPDHHLRGPAGPRAGEPAPQPAE